MNLFEIMAVLTLNSEAYKKGMKDAEKSAGKSGKFIKGVFGAAAKAVVAGIAAGTTAVIGLTKSAIDAYGEYEQLVGGAKLMFGDAYGFIADKAKNAYSTVQMSANDYLTQVNGFATGLKVSLGGNAQAAAELADKIVTAEADIIAATGASQESIQSAFNGIMKSNYTMLDNLQLGIKPTKEGMQEVIDKVNEWRKSQGELGNLTIDSLADCQSALVDYVEMMGMAGYAQAEGADTIQGSLASMKGAWQNFLAGLADPEADLSELVQNVAETAGTFATTVSPKIMQAVDGIGKAIETGLPQVLSNIPTAIKKALPQFLSTAFSLVGTIGDGIIQAIPALLDAAQFAIKSLLYKLLEATKDQQAFEGGVEILNQIGEGLLQNLPRIMELAGELIGNLVTGLIFHLPDIIMAAGQIVLALGQGFLAALGGFQTAVERADDVAKEAIMAGLGKLREAGSRMIESVKSAISEKIAQIRQVGANLVQGLWNGISDKVGWIVGQVRGFGSQVISAIKGIFGVHSPSTETKWIGQMLVAGFNEGLAELTDQNAFGKKIQSAIDGVTYGDYTFGKDGSGLVKVSASSAMNDVVALLQTYLPQRNRVFMDGREVTDATSGYMLDSIAKRQAFNNRLVGVY